MASFWLDFKDSVAAALQFEEVEDLLSWTIDGGIPDVLCEKNAVEYHYAIL